jgi:hypothetical protein
VKNWKSECAALRVIESHETISQQNRPPQKGGRL